MRLARQRREATAQRARIRFDDVAAGFADEKGDRRLARVAMAAGEIGVAGGEAMDEAVFEQKIQRAIDRDWGRALPGDLGDPVDEVIGAERAPLARENFENAAPARSQRDPFLAAGGERRFERRLAAGLCMV